MPRRFAFGTALLLFLALLCVIHSSAFSAEPLRLEFVPSQMASWQQFMMLDRLMVKVFPSLKLNVEPVVSKDMDLSQMQPELASLIKLHLLLKQRYPDFYVEYLRIASLSPGSDWRPYVTLVGLNADEIESALTASSSEELLKKVKIVSPEGPKAYLGDKPVEMTFHMMQLALNINHLLPASERSKPIEMAQERWRLPSAEILVVSGEEYAPWAKMDSSAIEHIRRFPFDWKIKNLKSSEPEAKSIAKSVDSPLIPFIALRIKDPKGRKEIDRYVQQGVFEAAAKNPELFLGRRFTSSGVLWKNSESQDKQLQLFLMSQCPYGVAAQRTLLQAKAKGEIPEGVGLRFHYIVSAVDGKRQKDWREAFRSLHGVAELEEDARQMVLQKHMPEKLTCYLEHRLDTVNDSARWKEAMTACGVDVARFEGLYKQDGQIKNLLQAEARLNDQYQVASSPTFLWKNRYLVVGLGTLSQIEDFRNVNLSGSSSTPSGKCQ